MFVSIDTFDTDTPTEQVTSLIMHDADADACRFCDVIGQWVQSIILIV
jgi:hypothetical protein